MEGGEKKEVRVCSRDGREGALTSDGRGRTGCWLQNWLRLLCLYIKSLFGDPSPFSTVLSTHCCAPRPSSPLCFSYHVMAYNGLPSPLQARTPLSSRRSSPPFPLVVLTGLLSDLADDSFFAPQCSVRQASSLYPQFACKLMTVKNICDLTGGIGSGGSPLRPKDPQK